MKHGTTLITMVLALLIAAGAALAGEHTVRTDEEAYFTFSVPDSWEVAYDGAWHVKPDKGGMVASIWTMEMTTVQEAVQDHQKLVEDMVADFNKKKQYERPGGEGFDYVVLDGAGHDPSMDAALEGDPPWLDARVVFFDIGEENDVVGIITFIGPQASLERFEEQINTVLNSVELID
jgi:hypothetical protein